MYPTGILKNTATGRWHPISFRDSPMPGPGPHALNRYKSLGHHTEGFSTLEEAQQWIKDNAEKVKFIPDIWEWDGVEIPAMVMFFKE